MASVIIGFDLLSAIQLLLLLLLSFRRIGSDGIIEDENFYKATDFKEDTFNPDPNSALNDQQSDDSSSVFTGSAPSDKKSEGNFFMDVYSLQTGPKEVEFGHVFEDPGLWEQRYEKKDHGNNRFQGQAKGGDKHGGYWEQYWDYNHGGDDGDDSTNKEESTNRGTTVVHEESYGNNVGNKDRNSYKKSKESVGTSMEIMPRQPKKPKLNFKERPKYFQLPPPQEAPTIEPVEEEPIHERDTYPFSQEQQESPKVEKEPEFYPHHGSSSFSYGGPIHERGAYPFNQEQQQSPKIEIEPKFYPRHGSSSSSSSYGGNYRTTSDSDQEWTPISYHNDDRLQ